MERVWKALADRTRRALLDRLAEGPQTTGALCGQFRTSRFAVMKHLRVLERARLIIVERRGRERWNFLNPAPLRRVYERWVRPHQQRWTAGLAGLGRRVEQQEQSFGRAPYEQRVEHRAGSRIIEPKTGMRESRKGTQDMAAVKATQDRFGVADVRIELRYDAPPSAVWKALVKDTSAWWPRDFYAGEKPRGMLIEPKLGGRMYEDWGRGAGAIWFMVFAVDPARLLEMVGHLHPPWGGPAITRVRIELAHEGKKATLFKLADTITGRVDDGKREQVQSGWMQLFDQAMRKHVEG